MKDLSGSRPGRVPAAEKAAKPAKAAAPAGTAGSLLGLQQTAGNRAVAQMVQRQVVPEVRDALTKDAKGSMDRAMDRVPGLLPIAARLLAAATPGNPEGMGMAQAAGAELQAALTGIGATLDQAISQFRSQGGRLKDLEHLLRARAHLSNAAFRAQSAAMVPPMASLAMQDLQQAIVEGAHYKADEAVRVATAGMQEAGPITQAESIRRQVEDEGLAARYLLPFGTMTGV